MKKIQISDFWLGIGGLFGLGLVFGIGGNLGLLSGLMILSFCAILSPKIAITFLIFSITLGEFGRISLGGVSLLITDFLAFLALISTLSHSLKTKFPNHIFWLFGFLSVALISLLINLPSLEFSVFLRGMMYLVRFSFYAGLIFTLPIYIQQTKTANYFLKCILWTALIMAILGFGQLYFFSNFEELGLNESGWDPHIGRLTSTWLDPNYVGGYFAFAITILTAQILKNQDKHWILAPIEILLLIALYFTFSRSAYLALGAGLGILALLEARWLIGVGILGILLVLGSSTRASERIWDMADSFTALFGSENTVLDPTSRLRVENWEEGLEVVADNPFLGTGYGTYGEIQWQRGNLADQDAHHASGADSSLLTVWATTGTLGLIFFLGFLVSLIWNLFKQKSIFSSGILAGLCGIFVHSFFVNSLFFTLILAGIVPVLALVQQKKRP